MRRLVRTFLASFLLIGLLAGAGTLWLWNAWQAHMVDPLGVPEEGLFYSIAPGTPFLDIVIDLREREILPEPLTLLLRARWTGDAGRIQAGEYRIEHGMSASDLLAMFTSGRVVQHSITLIEGWSFPRVLAALHAHEAIEPSLRGHEPKEVMARLGLEHVHPEGQFLPETYHFHRGTTDLEILRRARKAMVTVLEREWESRRPGLPLQDPYEALVLASIVEKETGRAEERALIAGVFVRRLRLNMLLQTDPTVIYGLGADFDGNLTREHLRQDTPYNTYTRKGLPPTPIAMPGEASIRASLQPEEGNALYFVSKGDGTHQFSATYEEHRRAIRIYQLGQSSL